MQRRTAASADGIYLATAGAIVLVRCTVAVQLHQASFPAASALHLQPCTPSSYWREGLRPRSLLPRAAHRSMPSFRDPACPTPQQQRGSWPCEGPSAALDSAMAPIAAPNNKVRGFAISIGGPWPRLASLSSEASASALLLSPACFPPFAIVISLNSVFKAPAACPTSVAEAPRCVRPLSFPYLLLLPPPRSNLLRFIALPLPLSQHTPHGHSRAGAGPWCPRSHRYHSGARC